MNVILYHDILCYRIGYQHYDPLGNKVYLYPEPRNAISVRLGGSGRYFFYLKRGLLYYCYKGLTYNEDGEEVYLSLRAHYLGRITIN